MSPRKAEKDIGRRAVPSGLSPGAESEVMTVKQAAEYLNCHPTTVYRLLAPREIPGFRLGGSWRFRRSDIEKWIRDRQQKAEDAGRLVEGGREDKRRGPRPKAGRK
jgi:excisionase family DNA binding protein